MKKTFRLKLCGCIAIAVMIAAIGFSFISCNEDQENPSGPAQTTKTYSWYNGDDNYELKIISPSGGALAALPSDAVYVLKINGVEKSAGTASGNPSTALTLTPSAGSGTIVLKIETNNSNITVTVTSSTIEGVTINGGNGYETSGNPVSIFDYHDLKSGNPPNDLLATVGLANNALNSITASGGYQGYISGKSVFYDNDDGYLALMFKGKTETDFNAMKETLTTTLTNVENVEIKQDEEEAWAASFYYKDKNYACFIHVAKIDMVDPFVIIPQGTMMIEFYNRNYINVEDTNGRITVNGLSSYNNKWIVGFAEFGMLPAGDSLSTLNAITGVKISGGTATLKVWVAFEDDFVGNFDDSDYVDDEEIDFTFLIIDKATVSNAEFFDLWDPDKELPAWFLKVGSAKATFKNSKATVTITQFIDPQDLPRE